MTIQKTIIAAMLATTALWAQAQTVEVVGPAAPVTVGDTFKLDIIGKGFTEKIFGGGYDISFDASKIALASITRPLRWELGGPEGVIDNVAGTATEVNFNTLNPIDGDFLTATLTFKALAAGPVVVSLSDSPFWPYGNEAAEAIPVSYQSASFTVAAVPEPQTVLMVLAGLSVFALRLRRHQG